MFLHHPQPKRHKITFNLRIKRIKPRTIPGFLVYYHMDLTTLSLESLSFMTLDDLFILPLYFIWGQNDGPAKIKSDVGFNNVGSKVHNFMLNSTTTGGSIDNYIRVIRNFKISSFNNLGKPTVIDPTKVTYEQDNHHSIFLKPNGNIRTGV